MSSDDQLNRMWYAGAYTAQMDMVPVGVAPCFTVPVFFDGAKRDRAIWSGDLMITDPVAHDLASASNSHPVRQGLHRQHREPAGRQRPADQRGRLPGLRRLRLRGDLLGLLGDHRGPVLPLHRRHRLHHRAAARDSRPRRRTTRRGVDANGLVVTNDNDYWQTTQTGEVTEYSLAYYELLQDMIWLESQVGTAGEGRRVHAARRPRSRTRSTRGCSTRAPACTSTPTPGRTSSRWTRT